MKIEGTKLIIDQQSGEMVAAQITDDGGEAPLASAASVARMALKGVPVQVSILTEQGVEVPIGDPQHLDQEVPGSPEEDGEALEAISEEEAEELVEDEDGD